MHQDARKFYLLAAAFVLALAVCWPFHAAAGCNSVSGICDTQAEALAAVKAACLPFAAPHPLAGASVAGYYDTNLSSGTYQGVNYLGFSRAEVQNPSGGLAACNGYSPFSRYAWIAPGPNHCAAEAGQTFKGWGASTTWPPISSTTCSPNGCAQSETIESAPVRQDRPTGGPLYNYYGTATKTGVACTFDPTKEDPHIDDPATKPDAGEGWKCDPATGLCTDPNGDGKLCTFNPDGSRSACVPYKPGDGTDPKPEDPDKPDDPRDEESVSGGGSCDAPPACTGTNKIGCSTLWQTWKTRCAVEKTGTTVGSNATCSERLSTGYACVGDAATCRNLNDTHAIRCSIAGLSSAGGGTTGSGDGDGDGQDDGKAAERAALDASGQGGDGLEGLTASNAWSSPTGGSGVGTGLFGGGGGCPVFPAVTVGASTFTAPPEFCSYVAMIRLLFLAVAYIWAIKIVGD